MTQKASLNLPDGQSLEYEIRRSAKAKSLRIKVTIREGVVVTAPKTLSKDRIFEIVAQKLDWIVAKRAQFDEVRHLIGEPVAAPPEAFDLPALAESWRVEYQKTASKTVGARTDVTGRVVVYGSVDDLEKCKAALRRWLARRAKETLEPWINAISAETSLKFKELKLKSQRTRWGSCSSVGVISLNCKLLFMPRDIVRYVLVHELCHTLEHNHTNRFWTYLRQFEPKADSLHGQMRDAWKLIPAWAQPVKQAVV